LPDLSKMYVVVIVVVIVIVIIIVIVIVIIVVIVVIIVVFIIFVIAFRPKRFKILLGDSCTRCNDMGHTNVDNVWKASNAVVKMTEFIVRVMLL
jgi:hypothetical protein